MCLLTVVRRALGLVAEDGVRFLSELEALGGALLGRGVAGDLVGMGLERDEPKRGFYFFLRRVPELGVEAKGLVEAVDVARETGMASAGGAVRVVGARTLPIGAVLALHLRLASRGFVREVRALFHLVSHLLTLSESEYLCL